MEQAAPFKLGFTLGERAETIVKDDEDQFVVTTNRGTVHRAPIIAIAGGLGCFELRKLLRTASRSTRTGASSTSSRSSNSTAGRRLSSRRRQSSIDQLPRRWRGLRGHPVHRREGFRGHPDSVQKVLDMAAEGKIRLLTNGEVVGVDGEEHIEGVTVKHKTEGDIRPSAIIMPLFGLSPKLGPIADWNPNISKNAIEVDTFDYSTNVDGIYAIGDINTYPGKLKLILCGFHEATPMVQSAFKRIYPDKNLVPKYTTVNGVNGF